MLKAKGLIVEYEPSLGQAAFASHQWVGHGHPDPEFEQMQVLQDVFKDLLSKDCWISVEPMTSMLAPTVKPFSSKGMRSRPLSLWYDYFSVPQSREKAGEQRQAIDCIPVYVAKCHFFFALCPIIESPDQSKVFSPRAWGERGWCRLEKVCRQLRSGDGSWVMIKGRKHLEVMPYVTPSGAHVSVGEGTFTDPKDREQLGPVLKAALTAKLVSYMRAGDVEAFRALLNLQAFFMRGMNVQPAADLVPGMTLGADALPEWLLADSFLFQNGFQDLQEVDGMGWTPLSYAALGGNWVAVKELKLSYYIGETLLFTIYTHYGDLS